MDRIKWYKVFENEDEALDKINEKQLQKIITPRLNVCLARYNNKFYVFENLCPHNGAELHKGHLTNFGDVICPLHSYCFGLNDGREMNQRCRDLKIFRIKLYEDGFYIGV